MVSRGLVRASVASRGSGRCLLTRAGGLAVNKQPPEPRRESPFSDSLGDAESCSLWFGSGSLAKPNLTHVATQ